MTGSLALACAYVSLASYRLSFTSLCDPSTLEILVVKQLLSLTFMSCLFYISQDSANWMQLLTNPFCPRLLPAKFTIRNAMFCSLALKLHNTSCWPPSYTALVSLRGMPIPL